MGVYREIKEFVVILLLLRRSLILRGSPRAWVGFCDPTAVSRFKGRSNNCLYQVIESRG